MTSAIVRRWRSLRFRSRLVLVLLLTTAVWVGVLSVLRWRLDTWPARAVLRDENAAMPLSFSPDGETILTYGRGGITPRDVASGRSGETWAFKNGGHPEVGTFSPDGKTYAAGVFAFGGPLSVDLFDVATGRVRVSWPTDQRTIMHLAFSPDGRTLRAFLGRDPQTREGSSWNPGYAADLLEVATWDVATGRPISSRPLATPTRGMGTAVTPDGRVMAIADHMKTVQLWDLDADKTLGNLVSPSLSVVGGAGLGFSDDGQVLAVGRVDGTIELWDVPARRLGKTLKISDDLFVFTRLRFSRDLRSIAMTGYRVRDRGRVGRIEEEARRWLGMMPRSEPEVMVVDIATGQRLGRAADSTIPSFSPDGKTLATGEPDGSTRLRDIPRPRP